MPEAFVGYDYVMAFGLLCALKSTKVKSIKIGKSELVKEGMPLLIAAYGGQRSGASSQGHQPERICGVLGIFAGKSFLNHFPARNILLIIPSGL